MIFKAKAATIMAKHITSTLLLVFLSISFLNAQELEYKVNFDFLFDNLEESRPYEDTRSYLAVKLAPEIGVSFDDKHYLMGGFNMIQDMGDSIFPTKIEYTLYYNYKGDNFNVYLGSFPRIYSSTRYARSFFRDDYLFYNPNIEGLMAQYTSKNQRSSGEFFFDWYGMNQELRIDEFLLVGSFKQRLADSDLLNVGADLLLNHFKNDYYLVDSYLLERFQSNVYISSDISSFTNNTLSLLELKLALLTSSERKRILDTETSWQHSPGFQVGLSAIYKGFGVSNDLYIGKEQMLYYEQYGTSFYPGSTFYGAGRYNRADIFYTWRNRLVSVRADIIFHITPTTVANQQMLSFGLAF